MRPLSSRQLDFLKLVRALIARRGKPPTYDEIADALGVTRQAALARVRVLERYGALSCVPGESRTLRLTAAGNEALALFEAA